MLRLAGILLLLLEVLLGVAHLTWPVLPWGQSRDSYFNFENELTLASWVAAMQYVALAILAVYCFHRERHRDGLSGDRSAWPWAMGALLCLALSFAEITRIRLLFKFFGSGDSDLYGRIMMITLVVMGLVLFGSFLLNRLRGLRAGRVLAVAWLATWGAERVLYICFIGPDLLLDSVTPYAVCLHGVLYLAGGTLLLMAVGEYAGASQPIQPLLAEPLTAPPGGRPTLVGMIGIAGTTFIIIFLQIVLFQMLTIFGDYLDANSVISIALLGISIGGLIGFFRARRAPRQTMIIASLLLPVAILLSFGTVVVLMNAQTQLLASIILTLPFVLGSTVITVALVESDTHLVYCIDLLGAGLGALLVSFGLSHFREEGSLLFLAALALLVALCFVYRDRRWKVRLPLTGVALLGAALLVTTGWLNLSEDWMNVVRTKVRARFPDAEVYFSRSSFVGRYDVVRQTPRSPVLKSVENGRTIDTIRDAPVEHYQIDPRLTHTLFDTPPDILIVGVSGDAITKTARFLGNKVWGVEINPVIVDLMQNELVPYNADCYRDIDVEVIDGRSYLAQTDRQWDVITLMNAHFARGSREGRAPCPEYLHTYEAVNDYLDHLTDRGHLIIEEVNALPEREPAIWKGLYTLRQALVDRGVTHPENHFFIFQWRTRSNNYIQILMAKNPLTPQHIARLKQWVRDVDNIRAIERRVGHRMGPIRTATNTIVHVPGEGYTTTYSRMLRGEMPPAFMRAHNLRLTTDNRPFPFDIHPERREFKDATRRTLWMLVPFLPFFGMFLVRHRGEVRAAVPFSLVVMLTGLAYFMVEMVSIQKVEIFLGSPVVGFATVLGTLLLGSGLGSLWSRHFGNRGLYGSLAAIIAILAFHLWVAPTLFEHGVRLALPVKVVFAAAMFAPLAFFMGVPFPSILRMGKERFSPSGAAMLFAINAASSAVVVPLAIYISTVFGLGMTFITSMVLYALTALVIIGLQQRAWRLPTNALAVAAMIGLVVCPWIPVSAVPRTADEQTLNPFEVYSISYGRSRFPEDKLIQGRGKNRVPFEWMCWLIRGHDRTILVDTGFDDRETTQRWGITNYVPPVRRLAQLGIEPDDITDVILTHAHWDHMGGLLPYQKATVWIQETEYDHARSRVSAQDPSANGMRWRDAQHLLAAERQGRLRKVDGTHELVPGVTLVAGGAHTPGSQYVEVETLDGLVILAGDATYLYENNRRHLPIGTTVDAAANLRTIRQMHRRAASPFFIIPGHDPKVMRWFPEVADGIVKITAEVTP